MSGEESSTPEETGTQQKPDDQQLCDLEPSQNFFHSEREKILQCKEQQMAIVEALQNRVNQEAKKLHDLEKKHDEFMNALKAINDDDKNEVGKWLSFAGAAGLSMLGITCYCGKASCDIQSGIPKCIRKLREFLPTCHQ